MLAGQSTWFCVITFWFNLYKCLQLLLKDLPLKMWRFLSLSVLVSFFKGSLFCIRFSPFGDSKPYVLVLVYIEIFQFAKHRQSLIACLNSHSLWGNHEDSQCLLEQLWVYQSATKSCSGFTQQASGVGTANLKKKSIALKAPGLWSWSINQSIPNGKGKDRAYQALSPVAPYLLSLLLQNSPLKAAVSGNQREKRD